MHIIDPLPNTCKSAQYEQLCAQLSALLQDEPNAIANMANMAALVYHQLPDLNWCGFYLFDGADTLVLGPFQGQVACVRIPLGKGVCGVAAQTGQVQCVPNVHTFDGHIACDSRTQSEIVVPLFKDGQLLGVWDVDSPLLARFDADDQRGMQAICDCFIQTLHQESTW